MQSFHHLRHPRAVRITAATLMLLFLSDVLYPTAAWALTSGPTQPEFTSFEPVVTTNMVNEVSGDFTYNLPILQVPGPNGGGYAMSLSYHSGASPEEEASWVGFGWTLNPGAINRQRQGIPDDWNGEAMSFLNKGVPNRTVTAGVSGNTEITSLDIGLSGDGSIRYNNYNGFGYGVGAGLSFSDGLVSLGFHVNDGEGSFSFAINPAAHITQKLKEAKQRWVQAARELEKEPDSAEKKAGLEKAEAELKALGPQAKRDGRLAKLTNMASAYGMHAITAQDFPLAGAEMRGVSYRLGLGLNITLPPIEAGVNGTVYGQYTSQENVEFVSRLAYGYLHSGSVANDRALMDYHSEDAAPFNKRDKFLPLPVNDADQFTATGEGIMGGMRFYNKRAHHFRPEATTSRTEILQLGGELNAGGNNGGSVDYSVGQQELTVGGSAPSNTEPDAVMRLDGDRGGSCGYFTSLLPENAHVGLSGAPGFNQGSFDLPAGLDEPSLDATEPLEASSAIGFHTSGELTTFPHRAYEKTSFSEMTNGQTNVDHGDNGADHLGELSVLNEQGQRYNYGLPVQARRDRSRSYQHSDPSGNSHWSDFHAATAGSAFRVGSSSEAAYATAFLLTSITDPDFVDRNSDGPTPDDLGGYTRFIYTRHTHGGNSVDAGFFDWRTPYEGYAYSDPELSECHDDRISYSAGQKEIYYLAKIMTRTHVAVFHTSPRPDGLGAEPQYECQDMEWRAPDQLLEQLDRIDLYTVKDYEAYGDQARPIKTVRFEYSHEAWPGIPNTTDDNGGGKLTLKRVWTEYNGVVPVRLNPYEFAYTYPTADYGLGASGDIQAQYRDMHMPATLNETPSYSNNCTDPWGNYRDDGDTRYGAEMRPWLDQAVGADPDTDPFDPAAWQLKVIKLPSGGEIHVQYEEDDYAHVQNEKASALMPLASSSQDMEWGANTTFTVDVSDLIGLVQSDAGGMREFTATDIAMLIDRMYVQAGRKMFFKFLYGFDDAGDISGRNREFITGYVNVFEVSGNNSAKTVTFSIPSSGHSRPIDVCRSLYNAQKRGKSLDGDCSTGLFTEGPANGNGGARSVIQELAANGAHFVTSFLSTPCGHIDPSRSYFRIPVGQEKRGGGTRVKRLLMVDPQGMNEGYPGVFGSEYTYSTVDEEGRLISSGVATYEPGGLREENTLVRPLDRLSQTWIDRAIAGRDRKRSEGPEGESLYPSPSIGYSQVIVRNIHHGKTAPAFTAKQFYTAKDFPVKVEHTDMDLQNDYAPIITGLVNIIRDQIWASQGYTVHLNEMHGKPKIEAEYAGDPNALLGDEEVNAALLGYTAYEYYGQGEEVPVMTDALGHTQLMPLGRVCDLTMETRTVKDVCDNGSVEIDIGVGITPTPPPVVIPTVSAMPSVSDTRSKMCTHVITKVVHHPAVLRRTRVYKDGIYHISENVAFDRSTGEPLVTRTHDGFYDTVTGHDLQLIAGNNGLEEGPGTYTSVTIPASMQYPGMGQAAKGEGLHVRSVCGSTTDVGVCLTLAGSSIQVTPVNGGSVCGLLDAMCIGDLLELTRNNTFGLYHVTRIEGDRIYLSPARAQAGWGATVLTPGGLHHLRILRSGCANKLREQAGSYTYYGARSYNTPQGPEAAFVTYLNDILAIALDPNLPPLTHPFPSGLYLEDVGLVSTPPTIVDASSAIDVYFSGNGKTCRIPLPGRFSIDPISGELMFGEDCTARPVNCIQFQTPYHPATTIQNVVASAATQYSDVWPYDRSFMDGWDATTMIDADDYDLGERGKWRPASHYVYNEALIAGSTNKDQGMYPMVLHNWGYPAVNDKVRWVRTDTILAYTPDGNAMEERDALGHPSCAKFGYDRTLPYAIAKNSIGGSVLFESFERDYEINGHTRLEDGVDLEYLTSHGLELDDATAHAGMRSLRTLEPEALLFRSKPIATPPDMSARKLEVKLWVKAIDPDKRPCDPQNMIASAQFTGGGPVLANMQRVARTGEWTLYAAQLSIPSGVPEVTVSVSAHNFNRIWVDDVRIQPAEAQMTSYVYDPKTFRLMASFDDQHFGLYYQYNDEGRLVRKRIETERGIRTVQETQYNTAAQ